MNHFAFTFPTNTETFALVEWSVENRLPPSKYSTDRHGRYTYTDFNKIPLSLWQNSPVLQKMATNMQTGKIHEKVKLRDPFHPNLFKNLCTLFREGIVDYSKELESLLDYLDLQHCTIHRCRKKDVHANVIAYEEEIPLHSFEKDLQQLEGYMPEITMLMDNDQRHIPTAVARTVKTIPFFKVSEQTMTFGQLRPMSIINDIFISFNSLEQSWNLVSILLEIVYNQKCMWKEEITGAHILISNLEDSCQKVKRCCKVPFSKFSRRFLYLLANDDWALHFNILWKEGTNKSVNLTIAGLVCTPDEFCALRDIGKGMKPSYHQLGSFRDIVPMVSKTIMVPVATTGVGSPVATTIIPIQAFNRGDGNIQCLTSFSVFVVMHTDPLYFFQKQGPIHLIQIQKNGCEIASFDAGIFEKQCGVYEYEFFMNVPNTCWHGIDVDGSITFTITTVNEPGTLYIVLKGANEFTNADRIKRLKPSRNPSSVTETFDSTTFQNVPFPLGEREITIEPTPMVVNEPRLKIVFSDTRNMYFANILVDGLSCPCREEWNQVMKETALDIKNNLEIEPFLDESLKQLFSLFDPTTMTDDTGLICSAHRADSQNVVGFYHSNLDALLDISKIYQYIFAKAGLSL